MLATMRRAWRLVISLVACLALGWVVATAGFEEPQVSFAHEAGLAGRLAAHKPHWPGACSRAPEDRVGLPLALSADLQLVLSAEMERGRKMMLERLQESQGEGRESAPDPVMERAISWMDEARKPRPVPAELVQDMVSVIRHLPEPFAKLFRRHVCAVVWMHAAPMTGTLSLLEGDAQHGIILLNVDNLQRSADDWLSFKEDSIFEPNPERELRGTMTAPGGEQRTVLLEFLLVHELAHVLDQVFDDDPLIDQFESVSWPRTDLLAGVRAKHYARDRGGEPLRDDQLEPYFDVSSTEAFSDPSAMDNSSEDFAQSVSSYFHGVLRGRPWKLEAWRRGQLVRTLSLCWGEERCREKQRILEQLLRRWDRDE
ncbi:MAG TPA: hypothetical protein VJU61_17340 [Polyangiaceae bacterium]|nr:hypothetical protein [Polyangiaceae bacterium]